MLKKPQYRAFRLRLSEIKSLDAFASAAYIKQINELILKYSDMFLAGRFVDT